LTLYELETTTSKNTLEKEKQELLDKLKSLKNQTEIKVTLQYCYDEAIT